MVAAGASALVHSTSKAASRGAAVLGWAAGPADAIGAIRKLMTHETTNPVSFAQAGALAAYTYFNIKPARFMMGDVGSLGLGALFAVNTLAIGEIGTMFFIGFMFYIEAITVVIQVGGRALLRRRIFKMAPIHHHFELSGWSEEKTIMRFWIIHFIFVVFGVWLALH